MSFKNYIILFCLLLSFYSKTFGQNSNDDIAQIRQIFTRINSDTLLEKLVFERAEFLNEAPDGGAELTGYFSNAQLVKVSEWIGFSFGIRQTDFYYDRAGLVFCFVAERHFQTTDTSVNYTKTIPAFEGRYYFKNKIIIKKKLEGSGFWEKKDEATLLPDSETYSIFFIKKKSSIK